MSSREQSTQGTTGLTLVIPAYNEEQRLGATLERVLPYLAGPEWNAEVIVVDDGSSDDTVAVATSMAARFETEFTLLRNPRNLGKGASVKRGVEQSTRGSLLFSDADLSTPIEEATKLLAALDGECDIAIGSRAIEGARIEVHQARYRELMGKSFNLLVRMLSGLDLADTQCGFKAFRGDVARELFPLLRVDGFGFDVEVLVRARERGYRIAEVPVTWRNSPDSRVDPVRDALRMAWDLVWIRLRQPARRGRHRLR